MRLGWSMGFTKVDGVSDGNGVGRCRAYLTPVPDAADQIDRLLRTVTQVALREREEFDKKIAREMMKMVLMPSPEGGGVHRR